MRALLNIVYEDTFWVDVDVDENATDDVAEEKALEAGLDELEDKLNSMDLSASDFDVDVQDIA